MCKGLPCGDAPAPRRARRSLVTVRPAPSVVVRSLPRSERSCRFHPRVVMAPSRPALVATGAGREAVRLGVSRETATGALVGSFYALLHLPPGGTRAWSCAWRHRYSRVVLRVTPSLAPWLRPGPVRPRSRPATRAWALGLDLLVGSDTRIPVRSRAPVSRETASLAPPVVATCAQTSISALGQRSERRWWRRHCRMSACS